MTRAADAGVRRSLAVSFVSEHVETFVVSTMQMLMALVLEVATEWGKSVSNTEVQLNFLKSGYLIRG